MPDWHQELVPDNDGNLWAPDIAYFSDLYHLYYSVSSFGSQRSAIGLVTNPTLDPSDANYEWTDRGPVVTSAPGQTDFNAIDPAIIQTSSGDIYMSFGSFWDGIFMTPIDRSTGHPIDDNDFQHLADRSFGSAIEAPYIYERDGYYYLFVNWDRCCDGVDSTYNIRVGRSQNIDGPYLDRRGVALDNGGGTLLLGTEGFFIGPGHASIFTDEGVDWFTYHYYYGRANGASRYNHRTIYWDSEGWPVIGDSQPVPGDYNNDGTVNAADYVRYRNLQGSEDLLPNRNPALDGPIGEDDYAHWLANYGRTFGQSAGSGSALVPEPATATLLATLFALLTTVRHRPGD